MAKIAILGAGQIGTALFQMIIDTAWNFHEPVDAIIVDSTNVSLNRNNINTFSFETFDLSLPSMQISAFLKTHNITHVINSLPFYLNENIAFASVDANCSYIDFTEDDIMANKVQKIFKGTGLTCIVKCGLAPGFINYMGYSLINQITQPDTLMVGVGALPRSVSYNIESMENSYNLTWSIDGLVNEYLKPCRIRKNNKIETIGALSELTTIVIDGTTYEAAHTSGGIGSLVDDLSNVSNVHYMTIRYPGHYSYIKDIIDKNNNDFAKVRNEFLNKFSFTDDDVIIVYARASGKDGNGRNIHRSYFNKFYGVDGLTAIQSTTAGSGLAILELIINGNLSGIKSHAEIDLMSFISTVSFKRYYKT